MKCRNYVIIAAAFLISLFLFNLAYSANNNLEFAAGQYQRAQIQQGVKLIYDLDLLQNLTTEDLPELKKAYDLLHSDRYYEITTQFLVAYELCRDIFLYAYEEGAEAYSQYENQGVMEYSLKTLALSPNCFEKFNLTCDIGDAFTEYTYSGSEIPVVLGAAYKEYYALHDTIEASYIFKPVQLHVVGFLPENTVLTLYNYPLVLDRYMMIPSWNCEDDPDSYVEQFFQLWHYANKLEGFYEYEDASDLQAFQESVDEVNDLLSGAISVTDLPEPFSISFLSYQQTLLVAKVCTYLAAFVVTVGIPLLAVMKMRKHFHELCVRYLFGATLIRIWLREFGMYVLSLLTAAAMLIFLETFLLQRLFLYVQYMLYPISSLALAVGSVVVFGVFLTIVVAPSRLRAGVGGKDHAKN